MKTKFIANPRSAKQTAKIKALSKIDKKEECEVRPNTKDKINPHDANIIIFLILRIFPPNLKNRIYYTTICEKITV